MSRSAFDPAEPPRAGAFIVTIYGDVVEPRGGVLWMGSLIEICAEAGLNESLVRTAVSRLVSAGQLEGERVGRRSYYRLTGVARQEFAAASDVIFAPPEPDPEGWLWVEGPATPGEAASAGLVEVAPGLWLGPDRGPRPVARAIMRATGETGDWSFLASRLWPLTEQAAAYDAVIAACSALDALPAGPEAALIARLRLVHLFRLAVLRDPGLPPEALPAGWPGRVARRAFARAYLALSPGAETGISRRFHSGEGGFPARTGASVARQSRLALWLGQDEGGAG